MSAIIDRRLNGKNKSAVNRQRFLRRYRQQIKDAVETVFEVSRRSAGHVPVELAVTPGTETTLRG